MLKCCNFGSHTTSCSSHNSSAIISLSTDKMDVQIKSHQAVQMVSLLFRFRVSRWSLPYLKFSPTWRSTHVNCCLPDTSVDSSAIIAKKRVSVISWTMFLTTAWAMICKSSFCMSWDVHLFRWAPFNHSDSSVDSDARRFNSNLHEVALDDTMPTNALALSC